VSKSTYSIEAPIITISQWQRQLILSHVGRESTVISGGVDPVLFHPYPKLSAQTGRKTIFYIMRGFGYTWKGNDDFIKACKRLKERIPAFDVLIVNPEPGATDEGNLAPEPPDGASRPRAHGLFSVSPGSKYAFLGETRPPGSASAYPKYGLISVRPCDLRSGTQFSIPPAPGPAPVRKLERTSWTLNR